MVSGSRSETLQRSGSTSILGKAATAPTLSRSASQPRQPPSMRRQVEEKLARNRVAEAKDLELVRTLKEQHVLAGHGRAERHVEQLRRKNLREATDRELFTDFAFVTAAQQQERRQVICDMEQKVAEEIEKKKAAEVREEQNKRRICAGSEELKVLKQKLNQASVSKVRGAQLLEKVVRLEDERARDAVIVETIELSRLEQTELVKKLEVEKNMQRGKVMQLNQEQIATKEAQRAQAFEDFMREKSEVDELVDRIAMENEMESAARMMKQVEMQAAIKQFQGEALAQRQNMEKKDAQELREIEEYAQFKRDQMQKQLELKNAQEAEKRRILNEQLGKAEARNREAGELEQLRNDLYSEELEAQSRRREEGRTRKKLEDKAEMLHAYEASMRVKEENRAKDVEEELKFRDELMRKYAEDDRVDQMKDQQRRLKVNAHKKVADAQVIERREMYEAERREQAEHLARVQEEEASRLVVIEEERKRILKDHASKLKDYLPKGTLETAEDFVTVGLR